MYIVDRYQRYMNDKNRNYVELVSQLFTLFYFFPLFFLENVTFLVVIKAIVLYLLLMANLFCCVILPVKGKIIAAYVLVVFATAATWIQFGPHVFYCYALFYLAMFQDLKRAFVALGFTLVCIFLVAFQLDLMKPYYLLPTLIPAAVLFVGGIFERRDCEYRRREERSSQQLEHLAAVAERERIARDLHDVLGHTLTSIALKSRLAEKLISGDDSAAAQKEIAEVAEITSNALVEVRQAISGYKSMTIAERLMQLRERLLAKGVELEMNCDFSPLKARAEAEVSLLLTEAVTNILRHSDADKASIRTQREGESFTLSIFDNGQVEKLKMGNGLLGIKERVEQLCGEFSIDNADGVCLRIRLGAEHLQ